jgi:hypothetical protein
MVVFICMKNAVLPDSPSLIPHDDCLYAVDISKIRGGLKTYTFRFFLRSFDTLRFINTDGGVHFSYTCLDIAFSYRHNTSDRRNEVRNLRGSVRLASGINAAKPHFRIMLACVLGYVISVA